MLVAMALSGVLVLAVYSCFSSGTRLWRSALGSSATEDVNIFVLQPQKDFVSAFLYKGIPFAGDKQRVSFAAGIEAPAALGGARGVGEISYWFDPKLGAVIREVRDISQIYNDHAGAGRPVLRGVHALRLSYLTFEEIENAYRWVDDWTDGDKELPVAVRFEIDGTLIRSFVILAGGKQ